MFQLSKLTIPKDEVLRYLGYKKQQIDENMDKLIDDTIEESLKLIKPKFTYASFNTIIDEKGVLMEGTTLLLTGNDISKHLKDAKETIIMAVTVGSEIEKKIKYYEKINLTKALILDSCATTAVEEVCDKIEENIKLQAKHKNLSITFRFSPGYGDLPLDTQKEFINTLKADKIIGVTVSMHQLLIPRKSVTAIIGLIPIGTETIKSGCEACKNNQNCTFRKEGISCGS